MCNQREKKVGYGYWDSKIKITTPEIGSSLTLKNRKIMATR